MLLRTVFPSTVIAVLVLSSPASAADAGPSATPLILELVLAAIVIAVLAIRGPAARMLAAMRGRLSPAAKRQTASARARGV
jgi:hypothetical protein